MAAGNMILSATSPIQLQASSGQVARLRTKADLSVSGGVTSSQAELLHNGTPTVTGPLSPGVTIATDGSSGFYKIPASKVRSPITPATLQAGTYVVTSAGTVVYHNMNYRDFVTASPAPTGTPISLPAGMTLTGPHPSPAPKFKIQVTNDVQINPSGAVADFALIPDGGAAQSSAYGGVSATTASPSASPTAAPATLAYVNNLFQPVSGSDGNPRITTMDGYNAWTAFAVSRFGSPVSTNVSGSSIHPMAETSVTYTSYNTGAGFLRIPNLGSGISTTNAHPWISGGTQGTILSNLNAAGGTILADLYAAFPTGAPSPTASPSASPSASATPGLKPKDLELDLQGGTGGLVLANDGDITIGAQVHSNGSALVTKKDIALIGTSTDLSSTPGTQLGLNLYAQGNITIDAFDLDTSGGTFHGVKLQGVVYAWHNINILASNGSSAAPFNLKGSLVAYGGDPAGSPSPGTAEANVAASSIDITYDPSYVASLVSGGPFALEVVSWHQF
jgi:hypothetical protein